MPNFDVKVGVKAGVSGLNNNNNNNNFCNRLKASKQVHNSLQSPKEPNPPRLPISTETSLVSSKITRL